MTHTNPRAELPHFWDNDRVLLDDMETTTLMEQPSNSDISVISGMHAWLNKTRFGQGICCVICALLMGVITFICMASAVQVPFQQLFKF